MSAGIGDLKDLSSEPNGVSRAVSDVSGAAVVHTTCSQMAFQPRCAACQKPDDQQSFPACSGCWLVCYCSKECQARHRKAHKAICKQQGAKPETAAAQLALNKVAHLASSGKLPKAVTEAVQKVYDALDERWLLIEKIVCLFRFTTLPDLEEGL
eukprot:gene4174-4493_t